MAILAVMLREDPCRNFLDGAVPFYPELSVFGHAPPLQPEEAWSLKGSTARSCTPFVKRRAKSAHVAAKVYPSYVPLPENTTCEWTTAGSCKRNDRVFGLGFTV